MGAREPAGSDLVQRKPQRATILGLASTPAWAWSFSPPDLLLPIPIHQVRLNVSGAVRSPTQGSKKKEDFYWPEDFVLADVVWVRSGKR